MFGKNEKIKVLDIDGTTIAAFNPGEQITDSEIFAAFPEAYKISTYNRQNRPVQTIFNPNR